MPRKPKPTIETNLPCDLESERLVLGSIMLDTQRWEDASSLKEDDFIVTPNKLVFKAIRQIIDRGEAVDAHLVAKELEVSSSLEAVGGLTYLVDLDRGLPQYPKINQYVARIKEKSALRKVIALNQHSTNLCLEQAVPASRIIRDQGKALFRAEVALDKRETLLTPEAIVKQHGGDQGFMEHAIVPGISTGYPEIDEFVLGLQEGCHYIVGGRTGSGKSSFAENIACNVAAAGIPVAYYSWEMNKEILLARAVCSTARVPFRAYIKNDMAAHHKEDAKDALKKIKQWPLYIDDDADITLSEFVSRVDRAVAKHKIRLVVVDYLQIANADSEMRARSEYERVTLASYACRMLSRRHPITTLALSQLTRPNDKRKRGERPTLNDLKASGGIENDAAAVFLIHRPEMFSPQPELQGKAEIIIDKSRVNGQTVLNFLFEGKYYHFRPAPKFDDMGYKVVKDDED
jgi:replicative DNA helicase